MARRVRAIWEMQRRAARQTIEAYREGTESRCDESPAVISRYQGGCVRDYRRQFDRHSRGADPGRAGPGHREGAQHRSRTPPGEVRAILKIQEDADRANNALVTALSSHRPNLEQLAYRFGTDKWGTVHWYTPHYERHFGPLSNERVRVMEIGIGGFDDPDAGGASLRMWQQ
jgi:hypothetical protein